MCVRSAVTAQTLPMIFFSQADLHKKYGLDYSVTIFFNVT